jgi:hypothetical protein
MLGWKICNEIQTTRLLLELLHIGFAEMGFHNYYHKIQNPELLPTQFRFSTEKSTLLLICLFSIAMLFF